MDDDHRTSVRRRAFKEAKVVLHDWSTFDCTLRNMSESGARLDFSDPVALPGEFDVLIVSTNMLLPAETVWVKGASIGVRFTGPEKKAPLRKF